MLLRLVIAFVIAFVIYRAGLWLIKSIGSIPPPPPAPGEMRRIKLKYRCSLCGTEIRMTAAPTEDPEPPRHCMEDMEFVPGFED